MTDQLDGEWFLRMMGLEGNLSDERICEVLKYIFKSNFDPEQGLVNATCPDGKKTTIHTYKNCQAEAVWTGIGYAFAALALSVGEKNIADTEINSIHNNQFRLGSFWDHWECGHHYTRPMSAWSTLLAAAGLKVDIENKIITLNPIDKNITLPLIVPGLIAKVTFIDGKINTDCIEGRLSDWTITVKQGD